MELPDYHPFVSADAKAEYYQMYDEKAKKWPVLSEARLVATSFGQTFVRISGPANGAPLVLLPGMGSDSLSWMPHVKTWSESFRIYAIDTIGNYGRSVYTRDIARIDDYVGWLDELFTALGLAAGISLMGLSYGGMLISQYALKHPERLRKAVLLAPAATVLPTSSAFTIRLALSMLPARFFTNRLYLWLYEDFLRSDPANRQKAETIIAEKRLAQKCFRLVRPVPPAVLTDEELRSLRIPVLFIVGSNEKIYSAGEAIDRLSRVAPQIRTAVIPNAGHDLLLARPGPVSDKALEFLREP